MLLINCPWCGPRDETEFHYGSEAHIGYPEKPEELTDKQWAEYIFYRNNPKGWFAERWVHNVGCRRWFNIWRNTVNHEFGPSYKPFTKQPSRPH
jgi:heterotetrameric sarcosine oxidase delta subunit